MKTDNAAVILIFVFMQIIAAAAVHVQARDAMSPGTMTYGQKLTSANNTFELGFFTLDSVHTYLGIWYFNSPKVVVWVANRTAPLASANSALNLTADGELVLYNNATGSIIWSTDTPNSKNSLLRLYDSGNLVLTDRDNGTTLWQSFDSPCDTFLPGMNLGVLNLQSNKIPLRLVSWKSPVDPSPGEYSYEMETRGVPELYVQRGPEKIFRTGPWNGGTFSGYPDMSKSSHLRYSFVSNQSAVYYTAEAPSASSLTRGVMNATGKYERWNWNWDKGDWDPVWSLPKEDGCDKYATCGPNSVCSDGYSSSSCDCLEGFALANRVCEREMPLKCSSDKFWAVKNVKLPDTTNATADSSMQTPDDCRIWCLRNCSCMAYAVVGPNGCVTWSGDLWDLRSFSHSGGDELYVRLSASELGNIKLVLTITFAVVLGSLILFCVGLLIWKKRTRSAILQTGTESPVNDSSGLLGLTRGMEKDSDAFVQHWRSNTSRNSQTSDEGAGQLATLPAFDLSIIRAATNEFSENQKLGEGGFGVVYKGQLKDGQNIAVKKLSGRSSQGPNEFRNELTVISYLQHRNLVRLLGYCIEGDERILILEYMENKSLDAYIYDKTKCVLLNWQKRLDIIVGIARGLLYLHQDSNLRVIHRDLKPSNILLDKDMNPKISDFGIARIFEGDGFDGDTTTRPIGTFGYMAPEYLTSGMFSVKSDVFSFGVIVLEILSGKRNRVFNQADARLNLLGHAYKLWEEGRPLEILDDALDCPQGPAEVLRYIQIGLLCVQESSECRPTMAEVVMTLASEDQFQAPLGERTIGSITSLNGEGNFSSSGEISATITGR